MLHGTFMWYCMMMMCFIVHIQLLVRSFNCALSEFAFFYSGDGTLSVFNIRRQKIEQRSDNMESELLSIAVVKVNIVWCKQEETVCVVAYKDKILQLMNFFIVIYH